MSSICYSWNDAPYKWSEAPFTWKEGCVIEKLVNGPVAGGSSFIKKRRLKKLDDEEKEILINLFVRLEVDEIVIEKRINKNKNSQVKIRLKDVEILMKEQKNIKVNIKINE
jgi:hypothetical protein